MISLALQRRPNGKIIPVQPGAKLLLEEMVEYQILSEESGAFELFFDGIKVQPNPQGTLTIRPGHWIADAELRIQASPDQVISIPVRVQPRQSKLTDTLWIGMLTDLENWLPGVSAGTEGGKSGNVGKEGVPLPFIAEALTPLLTVFERALQVLLENPRQRDITIQDDIPLRMVRKVDRETLRWVTRHPQLQEHLDPWKSLALPGPAPLISQRLTVEIIDHPANRYISWLVYEVESTLCRAADGLDRAAAKGSEDSQLWCRSRANALRKGADRLLQLWRRSFLSRIQREPLSEAALQVVFDDPTYLQVHQIGRLFLNPLFRYETQQSAYQAAVRPSYSVYELWAFLAVCRQMRAALPDWKWAGCKLSNLLDPCSTGDGALFRAQDVSGGTVEIRFNATFASYFNRSNHKRWSISGERRPDITISYQPKNGEGRWLCLDAKYRVGRQNLADSFSSVHIYRDALRYDSFGGTCQAVLLLSPARSEDTAGWFSKEYINQYGAGVWEFKPGMHDMELGNLITKVLAIDLNFCLCGV